MRSPSPSSRFSGFSHLRTVSLLLTVMSVSLAAAPVRAATIAGTVVDPDGRPVADARLVVSTPLGAAATVTTDRQGGFLVDGLRAGRYEIHVIADGLTAEATAVSLDADERQTVRIGLRLSAVSESLLVSAAQVDVAQSRAADRVTVVTRAELAAQQVETVADALRLVPGLTVTRSGGRGALTSIFPRGGESDFTLVLVDGMRVNSFGGGFDFGHLSVGDIDRIEVLDSPQSALYGADAIGGVIQIVTRRGGSPRVDALIEGGSQATARTAVSAAGSTGPWSFGGGLEYRRSDGFTGTAPASGKMVSNDDDHVTHASGSLGWQRPGRADVVVSANLSRDERGFPGPFGSDPVGAFPGVDRVSRGVNDTRQIGGRILHPWSARVQQRAELSFTDLAGDFQNAYGPSSSGTRRLDARVQEDLSLSGPIGASAGVQFTRERGSSTYITGDLGETLPIRRRIVGTFGELRLGWRERLTLTAGLRLEHITRDALPGDPSGFPPRPPFADQSTTSANPKVAASVLLTPSGSPRATRLHASAGTGIRPPDVFEIAFTDNPSLKPERSRSLDVGVEQQFASGALLVGATAFFTRYDDLIVTVGRALSGASRYYSDNISNARSRGLELVGRAHPSPTVAVDASYTWLDTAILAVDALNDAPPPFAVGDPLIRRPRHQGHVDLTYVRGRLTAFGRVESRSRALDVEPNLGTFGGLFPAPGYTVANLGAAVRLTGGLEAYGRVDNAADRHYEETLGYPALGRSVIVGVRLAASR